MTISVLDGNGDPVTLDPPTQTTLAAILAKLSADPATQTTLAAVLAKIAAAPATEAKQDALAALIGEVQASPTSNTLLDRLKAIQTAIATTLTVSLPTGASTEATLSTLNGKVPALGQALAAASVPVVLTSAQQTALTPPAAITGFSTEATLSTLNGKVPALGQALAAASVPVILPAATITTLTPPAAITGFATAAKQPALGTAGTASSDVITVQGIASGTPLTVGGVTAVITPTVTVSTTPAYTAGDNVGGKLTLTSAVRVSGGTGVLQSLFLIDTSNQKAAMELIIFNADPSATTFTDNGALSINSADVSKIIRRISITAADYVTIDSKAYADISPGGKVLKAASGTSLYAALVAVGTPTYAATSALSLNAGILQD